MTLLHSSSGRATSSRAGRITSSRAVTHTTHAAPDSALPEGVGEPLKERTAKGLFWGGFSNGMQQLLNLLFGLFLAYLLDSADYGMVGMLSIFTAVAGTLQDSGFTAALTNKKNATHADYNAVFWFSTLAGLLMYAVLFACAPLIASYFGEPKLVPLSRVVFLGFLISSTGIAHNAILFKHMQAKVMSKISLTAMMVAGLTGVAMALAGMAYWGLAVQNLAFILCVTLLRWHYSPWRPSLPIDLRPLKPFLGFSSKLLLTNIVSQVNGNIFSVILGGHYTRADVGYYTQGYKWMATGQQTIGSMVNNMAQPVLAQVDDDAERRRRVFGKLLSFTAFVSFPAMLGLGSVAREFIVGTIGAKWLPTVPIMQLLCVFGALWPIINLYIQMAVSRGRSSICFWSNLCFGLVQIGVAWCTFSLGILWMVGFNVAGYVVLLLVWQGVARRIIGFRWRAAAACMAPYALAAIVAIGVAHVLTLGLTNVYLLLLAKVGLTALLYAGLLWLVRADMLRETVAYVRGRLTRQHPSAPGQD